MEADSRDNWVMFFRTVFGFTLEHEQTLPDPYGLVRSLAVRSPQGDIRLALNAFRRAGRRRLPSRSPATRGRAAACGFACRDLPATCDQLADVARHARCRSRPTIMTICWRASAASWTLGNCSGGSSSTTAIPQGGAFLHLYTRPFTAGRFFFELTERRAGYALYGAANAAVRLAAMQYC